VRPSLNQAAAVSPDRVILLPLALPPDYSPIRGLSDPGQPTVI
jgi:hypothetical protein